jgi:AraC family transcriptional regulator
VKRPIGVLVPPERAAWRVCQPAFAGFIASSQPRFYGAVKECHLAGPLRCFQLEFPSERRVPAHTHDIPYLSLVLRGGGEETCRVGTPELAPFTVKFNPRGTTHSAKISPKGAYFFIVELDNEWIRRLDLRLPELEAQEVRGGDLTWLALQMYRHFRQGTGSELTFESLVLEMLGQMSQPEIPRRVQRPCWWSRVLDLIHSSFNRGIRISEIAREADVHPVYLSRLFRRLHGQTPGEYIQRLQVRFACERITEMGNSLAEVACLSGFSDQSHLTRMLKRYSGTTPGQLRKTIFVH